MSLHVECGSLCTFDRVTDALFRWLGWEAFRSAAFDRGVAVVGVATRGRAMFQVYRSFRELPCSFPPRVVACSFAPRAERKLN